MFSHSFVEGGGTYPQASLDRGEYMSTSGFGPGGYICEPVRTGAGGSTNPLADLDRGVHIRSRIWPGGVQIWWGPNPQGHRLSGREIRVEIPAATPVFAFHESGKDFKSACL